MGDYISELPDDIFCHILSFLTVRDAFRVKSLSAKWKDLPDCRSVLQFDAYTIFGVHKYDYKVRARGSVFVKVVDQFIKNWRAQKPRALKINFWRGKEYASHIDGWIESVTRKDVEELDLCVPCFSKNNQGDAKYVFPSHLLYTEKGSNLKRLRLECCELRLSCDATCTSWLSKLVTIELSDVTLRLSDTDCILSNSLNLESLRFTKCGLSGKLRVQHPSLKKLVIQSHLGHVTLSCSHLEIFELSGYTVLTFSHVPLLRDVSLQLDCNFVGGCSSIFSYLASTAAQLHTLSLFMTSEVEPLPPNTTMSYLKRLDLIAEVPQGFDIFTITNLLHASPILEALYLKLRFNWRKPALQGPNRQYLDRPHCHLKEVKLDILGEVSLIELVAYFIRNGVALRKMIFVVGAKCIPIVRTKPMFIRWQNSNPDVEFLLI